MVKQYLDVIRDATKAVPAVRYALGVAGVMAAFALGTLFFSDARVAFFATLAMLALMVLLVVFARAATQGPTLIKGPATILVWAMTLLFVFSSTLTVFAVFFDYPKPFPQLVRELFAKATDPAKPQVLEVEAVAFGQRLTAKTEEKTVTPRSESINVGCESDGGTRVSYDPPDGAMVLGHSAKWADINNIRDHTAKSERVGNVIVATGGIRGLDKNSFGSCPGGGHATLELTVTIRITTYEGASATIRLGTSQLVDKPISFSPPASATFQPAGYGVGFRLVGSKDKPANIEISGCSGPAESAITRTVLSTNIRMSCGPRGLEVERL